MNTITSHVFKSGYNNNTGFFGGNGVTINGVKFTDFSYAGSKTAKSVNYSIMNLVNNNTLITNLSAGTLDTCNKMLSMMWINWNGAIIKKGNFGNGEDVVISDTPEFLAIFNNISEAVYEHIVVEETIADKVGLMRYKVESSSVDLTINSSGVSLKDNESIIRVINNTGNSAISVSITNGATDSMNSGCTFKIPNPAGLTISIPKNGFGEISLIRKGNYIYARGA